MNSRRDKRGARAGDVTEYHVLRILWQQGQPSTRKRKKGRRGSHVSGGPNHPNSVPPVVLTLAPECVPAFTSFIERLNLTIRHDVAALSRRT